MTELVVSFEVDGIHSWPAAPSRYSEFRQPHRHLFKFICYYPSNISSEPQRREVEIWELRQTTISYIEEHFLVYGYGTTIDFGDFSCEGIADFVRTGGGFSKVFCGEEWFLGALVY